MEIRRETYNEMLETINAQAALIRKLGKALNDLMDDEHNHTCNRAAENCPYKTASAAYNEWLKGQNEKT